MSFAGFRRLALGTLLALAPWAGAGAGEAPLYDLNGEPARLAPHLGDGRWTLVMFWAADCGVCNDEAARYVRFHERHQGGEARVVGVSLDGRAGLDQARAFVDRHRAEFPNLVGEPREVAALFTALTGGRQPWLGTPSFLLYRPDASLVGWRIGPFSVPALEEMISAEGAGGD